MKLRRASSFGPVAFAILLSACASHAPNVECDKRLAPINVGKMQRAVLLQKDARTEGKPKP